MNVRFINLEVDLTHLLPSYRFPTSGGTVPDLGLASGRGINTTQRQNIAITLGSSNDNTTSVHPPSIGNIVVPTNEIAPASFAYCPYQSTKHKYTHSFAGSIEAMLTIPRNL